jgi:hypothetical protein
MSKFIQLHHCFYIAVYIVYILPLGNTLKLFKTPNFNSVSISTSESAQFLTKLLQTKSTVLETPEKSQKYVFGLGKIAFSLLPLSPEAVGRRKTIFEEVVPDTIWTLDQIQGVINVNGKFVSYWLLVSFLEITH